VGLWVASPGSRSTALVLAITGLPEAPLRMAIDERSAAFHALGWAKAVGRPAAVVTTSGSAVASLLPAVVEADLAATPLVVLTADRPPELRGVGANQTIDQARIFARFVRGSYDVGPPERHPAAPRWWRAIISQAVGRAMGGGGPPGPVHVNLAFREPTVAVSDDGRARDDPYPAGTDGGRPQQAPWTSTFGSVLPAADAFAALTEMVETVRRGLIVAGAGATPAVADLGERIGWPVLATAESGLRTRPGVIATGHHLAARVSPEAVMRFGSIGPSQQMLELCSGDSRQAVISPVWSDPGRVAEVVVLADPGAVAERVEGSSSRAEPAWRAWWLEADRVARSALSEALDERLGEPTVAAVAGRLGADPLVVASSMPIRDVEAFAFEVGRVVANRGASGIDGLVSVALGAARAGPRPLALIGDLSLLHDGNGFLVDEVPPCVFVVVDNRGGGIFSFLPQGLWVGADFERLFATPPAVDLGDLARLHHLSFSVVETSVGLEEAVREGWERGDRCLVVVRSDRAENVAEHQRLARRVEAALDELAPPP
jgi:2-succinyl-5-enolpyruvyl-6-hydroxy-3-cyclohexene-1-carboxylate synthase